MNCIPLFVNRELEKETFHLFPPKLLHFIATQLLGFTPCMRLNDIPSSGGSSPSESYQPIALHFPALHLYCGLLASRRTELLSPDYSTLAADYLCGKLLTQGFYMTCHMMGNGPECQCPLPVSKCFARIMFIVAQ